MDLLPTAEQQQIVDTAKQFLGREFPLSDALQLAPGQARIARDDLSRIAGLGWIGIGLDESDGGVGYGLPEEVLLFIELGRELMPPALLGGVLGARVAARGGAANMVGAILDGASKVALAAARPGKPPETGSEISGEFIVYEAGDADLVLVADAERAALLSRDDLDTVEELSCIDPTLPASVCRAQAVRSIATVSAAADPVFMRGALLSAALLLGIAEATTDRSVAYAKEREQYGKPIGSFQAIKHYCAEMAIRCEAVRATLYHASITLSAGTAEGPFDTFTAKALAVDAAQENANTAVQIHGGMGYTEEMDIHLFVKRAQVLATLFGGERYHLKALLAQPRPA